MSTKAVTTRIQHKHDLEVNWLKAVNFVPMQGELIIYDAEVDVDGQTLALPTGRTTPYTYERFKIGDGKTVVSSLNFAVSSEADLRLVEDLYTYTNIGKITGASNTSPKKVASVGDSLKTVFNTVFGTQQDQQPTIKTSDVQLKVDTGFTSYGGGEYGTSVEATDVTVTFELKNSGTANYGYRCGTAKTTGSQTFYYPVVKQQKESGQIGIGLVEADIVITLPAGTTAESNMVTTGTCLYSYNNLLYCNFDSNRKVGIKIHLPAGSVTNSEQIRYGQISASVVLGAAQKENKLTTGTTITKFLTYLGNDATDTTALTGGTKSNTAGAYVIRAGVNYPYYCASQFNSLTGIEGATRFSTTSTNAEVSIQCASESYIWFFLPRSVSGGAKTIYYEALGQWYAFDGGTSDPTIVKLKLNSGVTVNYNGYHTNKKAAAGTTKFKIE